MPDLALESAALAEGFRRVAGIDEAGRGPWAGPVVAAAVVLDPARAPAALLERLDDSKKLSAARRADLMAMMKTAPGLRFGVGRAEVAEIDRLNILQATFLAMARAVADLGAPAPDLALVDGNRPPPLGCAVRTVVKGDGLSLSIAAASVVAKVTRDILMADLALACPGYGWERNAGYGTREHQDALARLGVSPHHRRSYAPIRAALKG